MNPVCRLCLNSNGSHYETIAAVEEKYFQLILPEIDIHLVESPMFCINCIETLQKSYSFKCSCIETEKTLKLYAANSGAVKLSINAVVPNHDIKVEADNIDTDNNSLDLLNSEVDVKVNEVNELIADESKSFMCNECGKFISTKKALTDHVRSHYEHHFCTICNRKFSNRSCLKRHLMNVHKVDQNDTPQLMKSVRHKIEHDGNLDKKIEVVVGCKNPFVCQQCGKSYNNIEMLLDHVKSHYRQAHCITCKKDFTDQFGLKRHLNTVHKMEMTKPCEENLYTMYPDQKNLDESLKRHLELYKGLIGDKALDLEEIKSKHKPFKPVVAEELNKDQRKNEIFTCETCGKNFKTRRGLREHKIIHNITESSMVTCDYCQKVFTTKNRLKVHIAITHLKKYRRPKKIAKKHICDICGFTTIYADSLRKHNLRHTGEKPHKCEKCPEAFLGKNSLYIHMQTVHSTERLFTCEYCSKSFAVKQNLNKHILQVHMADKIEKKFVCTFCGKRFSIKFQLKSHMRWHTADKQFACDICEKKFVTRDRVKRHRVIHFPEKPHKCEICGKGFHQKYNIKIHMKVHGVPL